MPDCSHFWCQSGIDLVFRIYTVFDYGDFRVTVLTLEAPTQIIMPTVNRTRATTTGHILVSVSRFDYVATQIAADSILDYFHSLCPPYLRSTNHRPILLPVRSALRSKNR